MTTRYTGKSLEKDLLGLNVQLERLGTPRECLAACNRYVISQIPAIAA